MRSIFFGVIFLISHHLSFGQTRDEVFHSSDLSKSVQIYPNPTTDFLTVKFETPVKTLKLDFHTIIGNSLDLEQETIDEYEVRIKVKELPVGYYILTVHDLTNASRGIFKFLKR